MRFSIAPEIFEQFPNYCVGVVMATDFNNASKGDDNWIGQFLQNEIQQLRRRFATGEAMAGGANPLTSLTAIESWRNAFKQVNIKPGDYPSSIEALTRRALRSGQLPSINPAIDIANAVALKFLLPLGGHDTDKLTGAMSVRFSREGDIFSPIDGEGSENVPPGEPVYADDKEVRTRRWVWRQGRHARVDENSRNVFFPLDGWVGTNDADVKEAAKLLKEVLTAELGATCRVYFLDKNNPSADLDAPAPSIVMPTVVKFTGDRKLVDEVLTRGVADIITKEELEAKLLSGRQLRVKLGIDPTGPLIHIGRSVTLQKLRDFQRLGHQIVMLFGTFTGQIGDASDKDATRPMLNPQVLEENVRTYKDQVSKVLDADKVEWHYNTEWFADMPFKEGIKLMSYFTVSQMIERDNFALRLQAGKPVSLQEIIYPILQGYDSVMLKADVEIGGTDQLFNLLAGRTLQTIYEQPAQSVLMTRMINAPDGSKMSTSKGNGVFIAGDPKDFYAKMLKTLDEMIVEYFEMLTRVPMEEVAEMGAAMARGENPVNFKKRLAHKMVEQYHGVGAADDAAAAFEREHVRRELPEDMPEWTPPGGVTEMPLRDLLVETKLASGKKEADRFVEQNGVSIDGEKATDPKARIALRDGMILKRGNRFFAKIKL
jgi:tyrosyl-tRNA synthetase